MSLNLDLVAEEIVRTTRSAAHARIRRAGGLGARLRAQRQEPVGDAGERGRIRPGSVELIVVGTSTGGPAALPIIVASLPAGLRAPVVIAQHIPAGFSRHLAARLDAAGPLAAEEVSASVELLPGHIYLGKGDADFVVGRRAGRLVARAVPLDTATRWHPSVDRLVDSALDCVGAPALIGVLLTGMGDDGAAAMCRLRAAGGRTVAESEETAVVWGMPGELVKRGGATTVLPVERIADQLRRWV